MGRQIIKQPNGGYAVFSTIVDDFILLDATEKDIINERLETERERITKDVHDVIEKLEAGTKPYYQFTQTWEEALDTIREVHGEEEVQEIHKMLTGEKL